MLLWRQFSQPKVLPRVALLFAAEVAKHRGKECLGFLVVGPRIWIVGESLPQGLSQFRDAAIAFLDLFAGLALLRHRSRQVFSQMHECVSLGFEPAAQGGCRAAVIAVVGSHLLLQLRIDSFAVT